MSTAFLRAALLGLIIAAVTGAAAAQTRTAEIEAARDEKARSVSPEKVSRFEYVLLQFKQRKVLERVASGYNGLRLGIGSLATGSGFALGPDFLRADLRDGQMRVHASTVFSTRRWQKYEARLAFPHLARGRLLVELGGSRRDYRTLDFYSPGMSTADEVRSNYRLVDNGIEAVAAFQPMRRVRMGGSAGGLWTRTDEGQEDDFPQTDAAFAPQEIPGFGQKITYLRSSVFGQFDYRDDPAGPKSGGNYVAEYTRFADQSAGAFDFDRWDIDLQQYIPFFNRTRRIALRARFTGTTAGSGQRVPFHLQPFAGGSDDLRGYRPYRFTGPNAVVYNAEYRWEIFSGLDGALFLDAGKVMPDWKHMGWSDLKVSPGFGFRFNARNHTFIRFDVGVSNEGTCMWLKFNDPFLPRLFGAATRQPSY